MEKFQVMETGILGLVEIVPKVYTDERGYFFESYNFQELSLKGIDETFVQDNESSSTNGVLRGLHYQKNNPQGKLVRVIEGEVYDVAIDLRENSVTFGKWFGTFLSSSNKKLLYIPKGFAHGFLVTSDYAVFSYKCTDYYRPNDEFGLLWNDPSIGIEWPTELIKTKLTISSKDQKWPHFSDVFQHTMFIKRE